MFLQHYIISDNGLQFNSIDMKEFANTFDFSDMLQAGLLPRFAGKCDDKNTR